MKKYIIIIAMAFGFLSLSAQSEADIWELAKSDLKMEYKTIIIETLIFNDEEAEVFWPVFNSFMEEKNTLLDEDMKLLKEYSDNYETLDDDMIVDLVNRAMENDMQRLKARKAYFKKLKKELPIRKAGKLYQIDNQVSILLDFQIVSQVPVLE